jgi:hypothetical protein
MLLTDIFRFFLYLLKKRNFAFIINVSNYGSGEKCFTGYLGFHPDV